MRGRMKLILLLALVALSIALSGCGTESSGGGSEDEGSAAGSAGIGMSVQEALLVELDAPTLVSGYLFESGDTLKLCESVEESDPPQCGEPHLVIKGGELEELPRGELVDVNGTVSGTTLTLGSG
jgi:hypothetical protein